VISRVYCTELLRLAKNRKRRSVREERGVKVFGQDVVGVGGTFGLARAMLSFERYCTGTCTGTSKWVPRSFFVFCNGKG